MWTSAMGYAMSSRCFVIVAQLLQCLFGHFSHDSFDLFVNPSQSPVVFEDCSLISDAHAYQYIQI